MEQNKQRKGKNICDVRGEHNVQLMGAESPAQPRPQIKALLCFEKANITFSQGKENYGRTKLPREAWGSF